MAHDYYVYRWTGPTGSYIGKGRGRRAHKHIYLALSGSRSCPRFYNAIRAHGGEAFRLEMLATGLSEETAHMYEVLAIYLYEPLYNLTAGGEGASGAKLSTETRARMSLGHKGHPISEAARQKISAANKNPPDHVRQRMSEARKRRVTLDSTREKLSAAGYGRKATPETRAKMSASQTGHTLSVEARAKIAAARSGTTTISPGIREEALRLVSRGLSHRKAAIAVGVGRTTVGNWVKAAKPEAE